MSTEVVTKSEVEKIAFTQALSALELSRLALVENLIDINEAREVTGYRKSTIYDLIYKKRIPFHKVPGRKPVYFYKSELLSWKKTGNASKEVPHV